MDFQLYQVNQINQLLSSLNLSQLSKDTCNSKESVSTSSPRQEDIEMLEEQFGKIEICELNPQYTRVIPLLRNPHNINDHYKICWQLRDKTPPEILMSERFPKLDGYLKEYATLMGEKDLGLGFIQIYPHNLTLLSQRRYRPGQQILQIGGEWLIGNNIFSHTRIQRYLSTLHDLIQTRTQIFDMEKFASIATTEEIKKCLIKEAIQAINEGLKDESVLYLFELKFVMEIETAQPPINRIQQAQWLYFQLLPKSFNNVPFYHVQTVAKYHQIISEKIKIQHRQFTLKFTKLINLLKGDNLKEQFNFQTFLKSFYPTDLGLYSRYMNALTYQNYTWCLICQNSRVISQHQYEQEYARKLSQSDIEEQIKGKKAFLPIIDLLHHSQMHANVQWVYKRGVITLSAKRQINCGDILYLKYRQMPIQSQYIFQGFFEVDSESYLDMFFKSSEVVIDIAQLISPQTVSRNKKEFVKVISEQINQTFILHFRSEQLRRHSSIKLIHWQTKNCMKKFITLAENIYQIGYRIKCTDISDKDSEWKKRKLRKAQFKLSQQIYDTIHENLECKQINTTSSFARWEICLQ